MKDELQIKLGLALVLALQIYIMYDEYCIFTRMIMMRQIFGSFLR